MKKIRKLIAVFLAVLCFASAMVIPASAAEANSTFHPENNGLTESQILEIESDREEYLRLTAAGSIYVDESGKLCYDNASVISQSLLSSLNDINHLVDIGVLFYSPAENNFVAVEHDEDFFIRETGDNADLCSPYAYMCDCTYPKLELGALVKSNTKIIRNYFISTAKVNPSGALAATIGYWVGKVNHKGDWDYKVTFTSSRYCCNYGKSNSKTGYHLTGEFIGNYNYGYTGSILFSLSVLKAGSIAAAGFDLDKDLDDHPAIEEGYNDAKACGEYLS